MSPKELIETFIQDELYLKRTSLCDIMEHCGSDKSTIHNYTPLYNYLFSQLGLKDKPISLLEMGIGLTDINIPCNMGPTGTSGASLRAFERYFPNAMIYGADIDKSILFETDHIKTYYCNQLVTDDIDKLWKQIDKQVNVIIDDGFHNPEANLLLLNNSFQYLANGGLYFVEDIHPSWSSTILENLESLSCNYKGILSIPPDTISNILVIVK
jgi:hypothetical protein